MSRKYYKPNTNGYSDEKIIKLVFEDKKRLYDSFGYINELANPLSAATQPGKFAKDEGKDAGKSVLNFLAFNKICRNVAASLNKNWTLKRTVGSMVKDIYLQSIVVLAFFYKSKFKLIIWRGFNQYYSWDLAMAAILLYEGYKDDKGISYSYSQSTKVTPQMMKEKILEYFGKIRTTKSLTISPITLDVVDGDAISSDSSGSSAATGGGAGNDAMSKLITIDLNRLPNATPADLILKYEEFKKNASGTTLEHFENCIAILEELNNVWSRGLASTEISEIADSLKQSKPFISMIYTGGNSTTLEDANKKKIFITNNEIKIDKDFSLKEIVSVNAKPIPGLIKKYKFKIMFSYLRYNLDPENKKIIDPVILAISNKLVSK